MQISTVKEGRVCGAVQQIYGKKKKINKGHTKQLERIKRDEPWDNDRSKFNRNLFSSTLKLSLIEDN